MSSESERRQKEMDAPVGAPEEGAYLADRYDADEEEEETGRLSRRYFLRLGAGALGVLTALELGGTAVLYLRGAEEGKATGGIVEVGLVEEFPPRSVTEFRVAGFFLVRAPEGGFLAVQRRCPHLGCTVEWVPEKDRFYCPCHGSSFDFFGGMEDPPVPRPLDTYRVFVEEGIVKVDTSKPLQRERYEPAQLVYDSSTELAGSFARGQELPASFGLRSR
jgi:cytochrome b6-f complex iron-sulfur subunit